MFENYIEEKNLHSVEGSSGVANLKTIIEELPSSDDYGTFSPMIDDFLSDNPGAIEALREWISDNYSEAFEPWSDD